MGRSAFLSGTGHLGRARRLRYLRPCTVMVYVHHVPDADLCKLLLRHSEICMSFVDHVAPEASTSSTPSPNMPRAARSPTH